jgi:flagellar export protein FliJ
LPQFRFRLASVLRFRDHVKRQKQSELALLNEKSAELRAEIESLEHECDNTVEFSQNGTDSILPAEEFRIRADYVSSLLLRLMEKRALLAELEKQLRAKREEVIEAMRAVKTLEQLRTRLAEKFWRDLQVAEQKHNDEIGLRKFFE